MNKEITMGLFVILGVIVGGVFTLFAAKIGFEKDKIKRDLLYLCDQIMSFQKLEELYKIELGKCINKNEITVMKEMRARVQEETELGRPTITPSQIAKLKEKYS